MAVVCARLFFSGLHRKYRFFFSYLVFTVFRSAVLMSLDFRGAAYFQFWVLTEIPLWFFYVQVVLELYSLILREYRGLYTVGRWALHGALGLSVIISSIAIFSSWSTSFESSKILPYIVMTERGLSLSLVIFLFLILVFLGWYPVPLCRNVIVYSVVYSVYFLSNTVVLLVLNLMGLQALSLVNTAILLVDVACALVWLFGLTAKGEEKVVVLRYDWKPEDERRLLDQLTAINSSLVRTARQ